MNLRDFHPEYLGDRVDVDERPGAYYVSVVNGDQVGLLAGPFGAHRDAIGKVDAAKEVAHRVGPWSVFYAFGTCRLDAGCGPGVLNAELGITGGSERAA